MLSKTSDSGLPIVAICGATGTGKSKLAIDIARAFNGEVINTDAMQLYEGLEIATNKVTQTEAAGVPHHLLGTFSATLAGRFDVRVYRQLCLPLIDKIRTEHMRIPILTGGTHYYLEAVLWSDFLSSNTVSSDEAETYTSLALPTDPADCYTRLKQLDPTTAAHLHPNNVRKVRRALAQSLLRERRLDQTSCIASQSCEPDHGPPNRSYHPRYPTQTLIFWTDCDGELLNQRLDQRVDAMVQAGLVEELDRFLEKFFTGVEETDTKNILNSEAVVPDRISRLFTENLDSQSDPFVRRGILQSIGFKEFADYLAIPVGSERRTSAEGQKLLHTAIDRVKTATRQYARRQIKWITNRFLKRPALGGLPIYRIPVSEVFRSNSMSPVSSSDWDRLVLAPVVRIIYDHLLLSQSMVHQSATLQSLLDLCPSHLAPQPCPFVSESPLALSAEGPPFVCSACSNRVFVRHEDWLAHTKSRSHQKRVAKARRRAIIQTAVEDEQD